MTKDVSDQTRDRATFDPATPAYVVYSVPAPTDAPASLTFGSSFMSLAATYPGTVVVGKYQIWDSLWRPAYLSQGLNRGKDNITNTIAAAKVAKSKINNLLAIELGNEPECKSASQTVYSLLISSRLRQRWPANCSQSFGLESGHRCCIAKQLDPASWNCPLFKEHNPSREFQ